MKLVINKVGVALSVLKICHPFDLKTIVDNKAAPHLCFPNSIYIHIEKIGVEKKCLYVK